MFSSFAILPAFPGPHLQEAKRERVDAPMEGYREITGSGSNVQRRLWPVRGTHSEVVRGSPSPKSRQGEPLTSLARDNTPVFDQIAPLVNKAPDSASAPKGASPGEPPVKVSELFSYRCEHACTASGGVCVCRPLL